MAGPRAFRAFIQPAEEARQEATATLYCVACTASGLHPCPPALSPLPPPQYYDMPSPSLRNAVYKAMQSNVPPFKASRDTHCQFVRFFALRAPATSLTIFLFAGLGVMLLRPRAMRALPTLQVSKVHKAGSSTPAGLTLKPAGAERADFVYYDNIQ